MIFEPFDYNLRDLNLDVQLETCIDGSLFDFTGRPIFQTQFFKEDIGFGITDISITVNPSLQPLVEVTFKDLYGNTIFGTQKGQYVSIGSKQYSYDYSVLFNWPPPKFKLTVKGYLGKPVVWLLNLKSTSVRYNSSDSSYEVTCTFVPNLWGFFADLPFLYLLAVKGLKKKLVAAQQEKGEQKVVTVFDLIKIGKKVEIATKETSGNFDDLSNQVNTLLSNVIGGFLYSKNIQFPSTAPTNITGIVNNIPITGFQNITINPIPGISGPDYETKLKDYSNSPEAITKFNQYVILNSQIGAEAPTSNLPSFADFLKTNLEGSLLISYNKKVDALKNNLTKIDEEIKRRVFNSNKTQLEKITISEIFSRLAQDSAFIIGSILEKGLEGIATGSRDNRKELIGRAYPLIKNDKGEMIPAKEGTLIEEHEMKFVREFITAISEGIAENGNQEQTLNNNDEAKLQSRINNLEMLGGNPYKPTFTSFVENIFIRSGIVGYITRSDDPNFPGSYGKGLINTIRDDNDSLKKAADNDFKNISDNLINSLSENDFLKLKDFSKFFYGLLDSDGWSLKLPSGKKHPKYNINNTAGLDFFTSKFLQNFTSTSVEALKPALLNYPIVLAKPASISNEQLDKYYTESAFYALIESESTTSDNVFQYIKNRIIEEASGGPIDVNSIVQQFTFRTLGQYLGAFLPNIPIFSGLTLSDSNNDVEHLNNQIDGEQLDLTSQPGFSLVDPKTLTASKVINNGVGYLWPFINENDTFYGIIFQGDDATKVQSVNSSDSDSQVSTEDKDSDWIDVGQSEIPGIVPLNAEYKDEEGDVLQRFKDVNDYTKNGYNLDYSKLSNLTYIFQQSPESFQWNMEFTDPATVSVGKIPPGNYSWTVFGHYYEDSISIAVIGGTVKDNLVFGPFVNGRRGRNQRIFIYQFCKNLIERLEKVENDRRQVVANILGKANEQENLLYIQFHHLYHQWNSIIFGEDCTTPNINGKGFAEELEKSFGDEKNHVDGQTIQSPCEQQNDEDGSISSSFVYDYPLKPSTLVGEENRHKFNVKNSIINLEPLYKPDSKTTVLNIIQQVCTKNNFIFIPIAGNSNYRCLKEVFLPYPLESSLRIKPKNFFHVMFAPTPESRSKNNENTQTIDDVLTQQKNRFNGDALLVKFGAIDNKIVKNVSVSTDDNKVTAESIVNLQRLVDPENKNKVVTTDCSMLPVLEGRSYKASCTVLGNAQIFPFQYFFLDRSPLFGGLYQIMEVKHKITPNNMETTFEGIRMSFAGGDFGGIPPITLETLSQLGNVNQPIANENNIKVQENLPKKEKEVVTSTNPVEAPPPPQEVSALGFANPVGGSKIIVTSAPGPRNNPLTQDPQIHEGADISVAYGTPIYAVQNGLIEMVRVGGGFGCHLIILHKLPNGTYLRTLSAHLSEVVPSIFDFKDMTAEQTKNILDGIMINYPVTRGQLIGYSGGIRRKRAFIVSPGGSVLKENLSPSDVVVSRGKDSNYGDFAGSSTGGHLHFEMKKYEGSVIPKDPFTLRSIYTSNTKKGGQSILLNPLDYLPGPFILNGKTYVRS